MGRFTVAPIFTISVSQHTIYDKTTINQSFTAGLQALNCLIVTHLLRHAAGEKISEMNLIGHYCE